jgi:hypothetical protein
MTKFRLGDIVRVRATGNVRRITAVEYTQPAYNLEGFADDRWFTEEELMELN